MIHFHDVHKGFDGQAVLRGVTLAVARGSVHYIIGESGGGKSVLLKQVVGLLRPDRGTVTFDGINVGALEERELRPVRARCQLIFQHATLFESLDVQENVAMPVRKRTGLSREAARERAMAALHQVHATELAQRSPAELGAGTKKRVAIARALALAPEALLYDEPTTALDPVAARRIDRLIRETSDALGLTSVIVSHDLASVRTGDRVTYLREGRVHFDGTPAELFASTDPDVRRFVHGERPRFVPRTQLETPASAR